MPIHNHDISEIFEKVADLLEIEGANPFRVRAYRNAARVVGGLSQNLVDLVARDADLTGLPGVGQDLAGKIVEIVKTGDLGLLKELEARTPPALALLMNVAGLGPKRVHILHEKLGVTSVEDLQAAAQAVLNDAVEFGFFEPAWFIKLRELTLTYTAPASWAHMFRADRMSVTLSARNLWTITDYSGVDPEVNGFGQSNFSSTERRSYAQTAKTLPGAPTRPERRWEVR